MHWYDLLPVLLLGLLFLGPKRLPEIGSSVGKTIREFQKGMREITSGFDGQTPVSAPKVDTPPILPAAPTTESVNATAEAVHSSPSANAEVTHAAPEVER
jgi:sec-independent protein translocase protein TatA